MWVTLSLPLSHRAFCVATCKPRNSELRFPAFSAHFSLEPLRDTVGAVRCVLPQFQLTAASKRIHINAILRRRHECHALLSNLFGITAGIVVELNPVAVTRCVVVFP